MEELMARYLADDLSEGEKTSFETKLITSEEVRSEFEAYLNLWHLTHDSDTTISFDKDNAWEVVNGNTEEQSKVVPMAPRRPYSTLKIAATFLILAVSGYFVAKSINIDKPQSEIIQIASERGVKEVELPDGSMVRMNANSTITYNEDFNTSIRKVTLVGEADFDVVRNEKVPFVVEAGVSRIEVLGTSFDVVAYPNETIELNVSEGKVAFAAMDDVDNGEIVIKGQKAVLDIEKKEIQVSAAENFNYSGWWTRKLEYEGTPLKEVLEDLEKTYWVQFEYNVDDIKDCNHTGTYDGKSIDDIIGIIEASHGIESSRTQENKIKLSGKGCSD